jgi:hypothetical protein
MYMPGHCLVNGFAFRTDSLIDDERRALVEPAIRQRFME